MLSRMMRHIRREPLPALAVFLFAVVLSGLLCVLRQTQLKEQEDYEKAYASVPVYLSVVELNGTSPDDTIIGWAANLFYEESNLEPCFSKFVKDVVLKMKHRAITSNNRSKTVIGISSLHWLRS